MKVNQAQLPWYFSNHSLLVATCVFSLLLSACASTGSAKKNPVEDRAQQRWDALLALDYDTAYSLYSPGYRSANSRVDFEISQRTRKIGILAAQVESSDCDADACTVSTNVQYRVGSPIPGVNKWESTSKVLERWVRTEGKWWYVPEE
ncbi:MAG TPA: hypothetical protein VFG52_09160 [Xanthomonadales bacterium]|nr:hypothetical protein [Xanthomonadales bacterium]